MPTLFLKRSEMQAYGFQTVEKQVDNLAEHALVNYVKNVVHKMTKKHKNVEKFTDHHVQSGGRVSMPIDFFGTPSSSYAEGARTNYVIRPEIAQTFKPILTTGGAGAAAFTTTHTKVSEAITKTKTPMTKSAAKAIKLGFETKMHDALTKMSKTTKGVKELTTETFSKVVAQRKFKMLQQQ
jgi:hypothetical protein